MASMNIVMLAGNLTRDVETKTLDSGAAVANMGLAVSRKFKRKDGENGEEVLFVDLVVFGKQAENCGKYLHKGDPVLIEGRLKYEEWTDKDTDKKRSKIRVVATNVQFLNRARRNGAADGEAPNAAGNGSAEEEPLAF